MNHNNNDKVFQAHYIKKERELTISVNYHIWKMESYFEACYWFPWLCACYIPVASTLRFKKWNEKSKQTNILVHYQLLTSRGTRFWKWRRWSDSDSKLSVFRSLGKKFFFSPKKRIIQEVYKNGDHFMRIGTFLASFPDETQIWAHLSKILYSHKILFIFR